jgi:hypothetical protein
MTLFLTVVAGSVVGQMIALYILGAFAQRAEAKKARMVKEALEEYNGALLKERQRMAEYAKLEG